MRLSLSGFSWASFTWPKLGFWLVALAMSLLVIWLYNPPPLPHRVAAPPPVLQDMPKEPIPIKSPTIKARPDKAKAALRLPAAIINDPAKAVVDSTIIAPSRNTTQVTTVVDTDTGDTITLQTELPRPWLAAAPSGHVWLGVGTKNGVTVSRAEIEQGIISVKALTLSARASVDVPLSDPGNVDVFAGVGVRVEW